MAITLKTLTKKAYKTYTFTGVWYDTFGKPATNFKMFIVGGSGNGKTSFLVQLAGYFADNFGRVCYVGVEEGEGESFKIAVLREDLSEEALKKVSLESKVTNYEELKALIEKKKSTKLWVIDSADALGLTTIQIKELIMQNHKKAIAIVGWGKGGGAKGSAGEAGVFLAGLKVNIKDFVATTISRFGGNNQPFVINERMAAEHSAKINYYTR